MSPGDLVVLGGRREKYTAINRSNGAWVDVYVDQVGIFLREEFASPGWLAGVPLERVEEAVFGGVVLAFAPGVLEAVR